MPESECRHNIRLAVKAKVRPASAAKRSQQLLMMQLGIARPEETISDEHLHQYAPFFDGSMAPLQLQAFVALFGLVVPDEADLA